MEKIVVSNYEEMSEAAGRIFVEAIRRNPEITLGLATGSTPVGLYQQIIAAYREGLDCSRIKSFNLDEYLDLPEMHEQSYRYFMQENLFRHINIAPENTNFPELTEDGSLIPGAYEERIEQAGGIDLQVLGIGRNGHIAFNEPDRALNVRTSVVELTESTIQANARFFASAEDVPKRAVSSGMGTIFSAKKIVILASGADKAEAVRFLLDGSKITCECPASFLLLHPDVTLICDKAAAGA